MLSNNLFILAGNGPYDNRGCEAIVRGTVKIIRQSFANPSFLAVSNFQNDVQFKKQALYEIDSDIVHQKTFRDRGRLTPSWLFQRMLKNISPSLWSKVVYKNMLTYLKDANAVLSIGGDNYSLDYGRPDLFTCLDDLVLVHKKPLVIWGASVGPFNDMPQYEKYIIKHLKKVTGIFVRESASLDYLASKGVKNNVYLMADPAFLLKPSEPVNAPIIEDGSIGINLSPLMAKYLTDGDYAQWVKLSARIIREIAKVVQRKSYLIPHVTSSHSNDYNFLKDVASLLGGVDFVLIGDQYNAAEIKWIISKMSVFAGARTHSTIAAFSTCVPTLSFVYSIKARGINRDIFGHEKFCILKDNCQPASVAEKVKDLLADGVFVHEQLKVIIPEFQRKALSAGEKLLEMCD